MKNYFVPPQSFNVVQMFQNPMMLIMVFGGLMMLAMPYITVTHSLAFSFLLFDRTEVIYSRGRKTLILQCCRKRNRTKQNSRLLFKAATSNLGMSCVLVKYGKSDRRVQKF